FADHRDAVGLSEKSQAAGFMRRSRDRRGGDSFKSPLHGFHELNRLSATSWANRGRRIHRAQQHFFAAAPAGEQADAYFHQAHVKLGMRLARSSMQRNLRAAAECEAEWRHHHWLG